MLGFSINELIIPEDFFFEWHIVKSTLRCGELIHFGAGLMRPKVEVLGVDSKTPGFLRGEGYKLVRRSEALGEGFSLNFLFKGGDSL